VVTSQEEKRLPAVTADTSQDNIDFTTYPARRHDSIEHKEKQAKKCRRLLSECKDQSDIKAFKENSGFSKSEYK
jgi:hypothetical protein